LKPFLAVERSACTAVFEELEPASSTSISWLAASGMLPASRTRVEHPQREPSTVGARAIHVLVLHASADMAAENL